jgi:hypothetical protein
MSKGIDHYDENGFCITWEPRSYKCSVTGKMTDRTNIYIQNSKKDNAAIISPEGLRKLVEGKEIEYHNFDKNSLYDRLNADNVDETLESIYNAIHNRHIFKDVFIRYPEYQDRSEIEVNELPIETEKYYYGVESFTDMINEMSNKEICENNRRKNLACFYCLTRKQLIEHNEGDRKHICMSCFKQLKSSFKKTIAIQSMLVE